MCLYVCVLGSVCVCVPRANALHASLHLHALHAMAVLGEGGGRPTVQAHGRQLQKRIAQQVTGRQWTHWYRAVTLTHSITHSLTHSLTHSQRNLFASTRWSTKEYRGVLWLVGACFSRGIRGLTDRFADQHHYCSMCNQSRNKIKK